MATHLDLTDAEHLFTAMRATGSDAGYPVGDEDHTPQEAAEAEGMVIIERGITGNVLAAFGTEVVLIIDDHGPWAVDVENLEADS